MQEAQAASFARSNISSQPLSTRSRSASKISATPYLNPCWLGAAQTAVTWGRGALWPKSPCQDLEGWKCTLLYAIKSWQLMMAERWLTSENKQRFQIDVGAPELFKSLFTRRSSRNFRMLACLPCSTSLCCTALSPFTEMSPSSPSPKPIIHSTMPVGFGPHGKLQGLRASNVWHQPFEDSALKACSSNLSKVNAEDFRGIH